MGIPTTGPPIAQKPYPILLKYQKFIDEEIRLLENAGGISKSLSPFEAPVIKVPPNRLFKSSKQQLCLVIDYCSLNKSMNTALNDNSEISYYPLCNIRDFSSKNVKVSGYHDIGLMP